MSTIEGEEQAAAVGADAIAGLASLLPVGVFATDGEARCTYVSERWCHVSGLDADAALGRDWITAVHPDDREAVRRAWQRFAAGAEPFTTEFRFAGGSGPARWVRALARATRDDAGHLTRCVGTVTESTDQRAALARLAQLTERVSDMVVVIDRDGIIRWANEATERVLGYDRATRLGTPVFEVVHPDDLARVSLAFNRIIRHEETQTPISARIRRADDSWVHVEVVSSNLLDEPSLRGIVLIARDLTDRYTLERRVHELEHSFTAAFRHSPVGRGVADLDGRWVQVNAALAEMLGRDPARLVGERGIDSVVPDERPRLWAEFGLLASGAVENVSVDVSFVRPDRENRRGHFTTWMVLDDDGKPLHYAADVTDVTEVRAAREAEEVAEGRLRALLEHSSDVIVLMDADGRIVYVSPANERLFGRGYDPADGGSGLAVIHPDDRRTMIDALQRVLAEPDHPVEVTVRVLHADGYYRHAEAVGQNRVADPMVRGVVWNVRDITSRLEAIAKLHEAQARFAALVDHASDLITVSDLDGILTYVSPSSAEVLGYAPRELLGTQARGLMHPDDLVRVEEVAFGQFARGVVEPIEFRARRSDGSLRVMEAIITNLQDEPAVEGIVTNARDVTDRRAAERRSLELVEVLEAANEIVVMSEPSGRVVYANRSARSLLAVHEGQYVGGLSSETSRERLRTEIMPQVRRRGSWSGELELVDPHGNFIPVTATVQAHHDEGNALVRIATVAHDITDLKAAQRRLEFDATHDPLTGLANRALFREIGERALALAARTGDPVAVLFLDLDAFKLVNDSYGHDVGDLLLGMVARRVVETIRAGDVLARLGGDEFVILCDRPRNEQQMLELADRIIETVSQTFTIDRHEVRVGLSIGIAFSHATGLGISELIRDADVALYRAKHEGRGRAWLFDESLLG